MATDTGITHDSKAVVATSNPSTALSTEMAGVIRPSPYSRAVPNTPSAMMARFVPTGSPRAGISSAVSARMPPSPWLSARITSIRYLTEMMTISAQNTTEATPYALARVDRQVGVLERLPERIQRARADVAVHDPQGAEREGQQALLMAGIGMLDDGHDAQAIRLRVSDGAPAGINSHRLVPLARGDPMLVARVPR